MLKIPKVDFKKTIPNTDSLKSAFNVAPSQPDYSDVAEMNIDEIFKKYKSSENGLTKVEAEKRIKDDGLNIASSEKKHSIFYFVAESFKDKFILILWVLAVIDYLTQDTLGAIIIIGISIVSAMISFAQNYSTYRFNEKLKAKIRPKTDVIRDSVVQEIFQERVACGDLIDLKAGSVIPADLILIKSQDLFINESAFTGESLPVEKKFGPSKKAEITDLPNVCLMGANVVSGHGVGLVITTGKNTFIGKMGKEIAKNHDNSSFEQSINKVTSMLIKYMLVISVAVFIVYSLLHNNMTEALLFALSVAVGITPSMLPMIVNVNLTRGSKKLARKKTLVKNIRSIQNLGSMDTLCTDKTGTLTLNNIVLQKYIDLDGNDDKNVLKYAYLNSKLSAGVKNLVDRAVLQYSKEHEVNIDDYEIVDEVPFDYIRKRVSIAVKKGKDYEMITKGAPEAVLDVCKTALISRKVTPISKEITSKINKDAEKLARQGMQVIAIATKPEYNGSDNFSAASETEMTIIGLIAFLDPAKKDAKPVLSKLSTIGVNIKILTGDSEYATRAVCDALDINDKIITGSDLDKYNDAEIKHIVEENNIFARLNPMQKERIVQTLRKNGHVVGFLGDGVNDAPSLNASDVGISVNTGANVAKESSDIILLEKSLNVIYEGVLQGRIVYGNIIKYFKLALSSDFGDVFSIMIASIFLPFLPLLPIQMLIQDFIFQISQIAIPYDNVDEEFVQKPRVWCTKDLGRFMRIMGMVSSITDVAAFAIFWFILGYNSIETQAFFQTAWFVECIISETMIIYFVRTDHTGFGSSNPSKTLIGMTALTVVMTLIAPIALSGLADFNFVILPPIYYVYLVMLILLYAITAWSIKKIYIKKYKEWL